MAGLAAAAAVPVIAEVTDVTAEVAEVAGGAVEAVRVSACACRENTSKRTMIPAAMIATVTARRAMRGKIGCGMTSSRTTGTDQTRLVCPPSAARNTRAPLFPADFGPGSPGTGYLRSATNVLFGHHRTTAARVRQGTADAGG